MIQHQQGVRETPFQVPIRGVLIPTGITSPHPPHCWGSWGGLSFVLLDICINKPFELKKKSHKCLQSGWGCQPPQWGATAPRPPRVLGLWGSQHRAPPVLGLWGYCFRVQPGCGGGLRGAGGCWLVPNPSSQGDVASAPATPRSWPAPQRRHNVVSDGWTASKQGEDEILLLKAPSRAPSRMRPRRAA